MLLKNFRLIFIALSMSSITKTFDRSFFYRASSFWDEPRFEISSLSTLNVQFTGGTTKCGKNEHGKETSIFGIYGKEKVIPSLGKFVFTGAFDLFEVNINLYQNLTRGFFLHFHLPIVSLELFPIGCNKFINLCTAADFPNIDQAKLLCLNERLQNNSISMNSIKEHGASDCSLFAGWSINYENTTHLDFIDLALQTGVLFPTGRKSNPNFLFEIPLGYNGHWGIPWVIDLSIGVYEWFTWGIHNDGVVFFKRNECIPVSKCPTGLLRLNTTTALVRSGPVWRVGTYAKADHICWGLSILMAMTFEQKNRSKIVCFNEEDINLHKANKSEYLKTWNRLIYQFLVEYDFAQENSVLNNRIAFFYNHQIFGKRVFSTNILGGYFGIDVLWCF